MDIVTIDFETYYDREYSLSRMTTESYLRDNRFEVIGVSRKVNDGDAEWYSGDNVKAFLGDIDYSDKAILCHNTVFDGAILGWYYGINPKIWFDTLSMARPFHAMTTGVSLKALAEHYGIGAKGDEVMRVMGMRRGDFSRAQLEKYGEYCAQDTELTYKLFCKLVSKVPKGELLVINQTLRMFTEPRFELDTEVLEAHLEKVQHRKAALLDKLGGEDRAKKIVMSNPKFAKLLTGLGVEPPTKTSPTTGEETYAFAKNDTQFTDLLEHPNPAVRAVVEVRLGTKSTIEETRTQRFIDIAQRGPLPILLNYYGAHTGRFSGGDKVNLQNLTRGGAMRLALAAKPGYVVVSCDSSQIEARCVAYIAGQSDLVEAFRDKIDVYSSFASDVYGRKITKENKVERHVGKTCILGLGYGMGYVRFRHTLATGYISVNVGEDEARDIVSLYRNKYNRIAALWRRCGYVLASLVSGEKGNICSFLSYDADGIVLPNGMRLRYPALHRSDDGYSYINDARVYRKYLNAQRVGEGLENLPRTNIYGAKVVENIVQAVARIVVTEQMVRIGYRYPVVLQVHDDIVCIVPESQGEACKDYMVKVMSTPPTWAPDLPLACEAGIGKNYGEAH